MRTGPSGGGDRPAPQLRLFPDSARPLSPGRALRPLRGSPGGFARSVGRGTRGPRPIARGRSRCQPPPAAAAGRLRPVTPLPPRPRTFPRHVAFRGRLSEPHGQGSRRHALPAQCHLSLSVAWGGGEPRSRGAAGDARPPATRPGPPESPAGLGRCARKRAASARTAALRGAAPGRGDPGASSGRVSRSGTGTRLSSSQVTEPPAPPPPTPRAEGSPWQHRLGDRDRVLFTDRTGGRGGSGGHSHPPHYQCGPLTRCLPHTAGMRHGHITVTLVQLYTSPAALYVTHTISGSPRAPPHAWE